ncbi:hypothetical protein [Psychromonas algicola]|uniref:hypothetical protein n=1 Tax=Psychromonas algicola TaxID=2555642 RepID=UPI00106805DE|nr:hypothetical protein [Psychromonas sp. RZ5]TEW45323.1 hypothetical protein E2R67_14060 [Psychromonas sp. RZ5]
MDYNKFKKIAPNAYEHKETKQKILNMNEFSDFFTYPIGLYNPLPRNENEKIKAFLSSSEAMRLLEIHLGEAPNSLKFREENLKLIDDAFPAETRGRPRLSLADCLFRWAVCVTFHGKKGAAEALSIDIKELKMSLRYLDEYAMLSHPIRLIFEGWDNLIPSTKDPVSQDEKDLVSVSYHLASLIVMKFAPSIEKVGKITEKYSATMTWESNPVEDKHLLSTKAYTKGWLHKINELIDIMENHSKKSREERKDIKAQYQLNKLQKLEKK